MENLERWVERCTRAERALTDRQSRIDQLSQLTRELDEQRTLLIRHCDASEDAFVEQRRLYREVELKNRELQAQIALTSHELMSLRSTATWRWTQRVLQSPAVQFLFGPLLRSVALRNLKRSEMSFGQIPGQADTHPLLPGESPLVDAGPGMSVLEARAGRMISERGFQGVPRETFIHAGREQLIALLQEGLCPESSVVEFGCGCLRIACWMIPFLDRGRYHGIDPAAWRVDNGLQYLLTATDIEVKRPRFDFNADFNSSIFGTKFDFFLARSIWTHASKRQIEVTLDSFLRDGNPGAVFLVSYFPARSPEEDYCGSAWVGTSHESSVPGVVRHDLLWIRQQCERRGLSCEEISGIDCDSQYWLRVRRRKLVL